VKLPKWLRRVIKGVRDSFPEGHKDEIREFDTDWYGNKGFPPGTFQNRDKPVTGDEAAEVRRRIVESLRHDPPVVLPSEMPMPPQPFRPPAFSPRHTYGGKGTIHQTNTIDVEVDPEGRVLSVWFRCINLPFKVYLNTDKDGVTLNPEGIAIEEITYVDLPGEGSSQ
jgi:hypothetical protein